MSVGECKHMYTREGSKVITPTYPMQELIAVAITEYRVNTFSKLYPVGDILYCDFDLNTNFDSCGGCWIIIEFESKICNSLVCECVVQRWKEKGSLKCEVYFLPHWKVGKENVT